MPDDDQPSELPAVRVNIVFDPAKADEVAERLAEAGLMVEEEFGLLGVVSGRAEEQAVDLLRSVEGVLAVETDRDDIEAIETPDPG